MQNSQNAAPGFGVYVHWPFCLAKCPYCDFNSHVRKGTDQSVWRDALKSEIRTAAAMLDAPRNSIDSIFFGGGTPSLMEGETVGAVLDAIAQEFSLAPDIEITLEANPTSVDAARFRDYRAAGVNRLSIGVQALNDNDLKRLGRWHSASEALAALAVAQSAFPRVSLDLIYARPDQTPAQWREELSRALALGTDHLSLYQLTMEEGTPFKAQYDKGLLKIPDDDLASELYAITQELCEAAGRPAYEVSNHAEPGQESRHNLVYWRYGDYLGIGPGAHGRIAREGRRVATAGAKKPEDWLTRVAQHGHGYETLDDVALLEQAHEMLLMGLRLSEGIDLDRYQQLAGQPLESQILIQLTAEGLLTRDGPRLTATSQGRLVLNGVIAALVQG